MRIVICVAFSGLSLGWQTVASPLKSAELPATADEEMINGAPLSLLVGSLEKKEFRQQRLRALTDIALYAKSPGKYISFYLDALKDSDEIVRQSAARNLGKLGNRLPSLVDKFLPQLKKVLEDPLFRVRSAGAYAFSDMGNAGRDALPDLRRLYKTDKFPMVRESALTAIVSVSQGSDDQLPALLLAVNQDEFRIHSDWLRSLAGYGRISEEAVPAIHQALRRSKMHKGSTEIDLQIQTDLQFQAVSGLGNIGPKAKIAIPDLFELLNEPIKYQNVYAPRNRGEPEQTRVVVAKDRSNFRIRLTAAWAITRIDSASVPKLFDVLKKQLDDDNADMRLSSMIIVNRLSDIPIAQQMVPDVKRLVTDSDPDVRTIARLAQLRLADSKSKGPGEARELTSYSLLNNAPLPRDHKKPGNNKDMLESLKSKLNEIKKYCEAGDLESMVRSTMLPTEFEDALLQGDIRRQSASKGRRKSEAYKKLIDQIQYETIKITGRGAVVPIASKRYQLHFYWFDGDWHLVGSGA